MLNAQRVAFAGRLHGQPRSDIYTMKTDGTEISRVTVSTTRNADMPAWAR